MELKQGEKKKRSWLIVPDHLLALRPGDGGWNKFQTHGFNKLTLILIKRVYIILIKQKLSTTENKR